MMSLLLRWIAVAGLLLGIVGLVVAGLGAAEFTLAAGAALAVVSLVVLLWNEGRSWSTRSARHVLTTWRDLHRSPDDPDRLVHDAIVTMESHSATRKLGGPVTGTTWRLLPDVY